LPKQHIETYLTSKTSPKELQACRLGLWPNGGGGFGLAEEEKLFYRIMRCDTFDCEN